MPPPSFASGFHYYQRFGTSKERPAGPLLNVSPQRMCFPNDFPVRSQPSMTTSTRITNRTSKQLAPPDIKLLLPPPSPHLSTLLLMNSMCSTDSTDGPEEGWQVSHADQNCSKTVRAEIVRNTPTSRLQIEKSGSDREVSPVLDVPNVILLRESCSRYSESSTTSSSGGGGGGISKSHKMKQFTPNNNCKHNKTATAPSLSHQPTSITFHNPRKTHYAKRKRTCNSITKEELLSVLHLSQTQACQVLGCSVSTVKRRFYDLKDEIGISHWPKDYFELAIHNKKVFQKIYPMSLSFILNPEQEQQSME
ncbi:hypothetical protein C9374_012375 [Naegleria lovaniensis]|uniref:RWP-RK domain-containing protein n=1 Tax=Naegleria lovaniensis TaxID=51637 RepID=A0AA88KNH8_NAELO|nr:uncharacterized protein C9374_012375 [Naegleria lovaniensis]KAG2392123.1 hypothetical protein C9374_012375 [Naegleria lovaniensis]